MTIFNPLNQLPPTELEVTLTLSTSRCLNEVAGVCLKCNCKMDTARLAKGDVVYYCVSCRVASPIEDKN